MKNLLSRIRSVLGHVDAKAVTRSQEPVATITTEWLTSNQSSVDSQVPFSQEATKGEPDLEKQGDGTRQDARVAQEMQSPLSLLEVERSRRRSTILEREIAAITEQEERKSGPPESEQLQARISARAKAACKRIDTLSKIQAEFIMKGLSDAVGGKLDLRSAIAKIANDEALRIGNLLDIDREQIERELRARTLREAERSFSVHEAEMKREKVEQERKEEVERQKIENVELPPVFDFINLHANTLLRKYRDTQSIDDYGLTISDDNAWIKEWEYFIDSVLVRQFDEELVSRYRNKIFQKLIEEVTKAWARSLAVQYNGTQVTNEMSGEEYENVCAHILKGDGWHVSLTGRTGDQGIDLVAEKGGVMCAIQCKRWEGNVGNTAIQEIVAGRNHIGADYAAVVTNASFTRPARALAATNKVALLHHDDLERLDSVIAELAGHGRTVLR